MSNGEMNTATGSADEGLPDMGMQGFTMVEESQLPDPTPPQTDGSLIDYVMSLFAGGYGIAIFIFGLWAVFSLKNGFDWKPWAGLLVLFAIGGSA